MNTRDEVENAAHDLASRCFTVETRSRLRAARFEESVRPFIAGGQVPTVARRLIKHRDTLPSASDAVPSNVELEAVWSAFNDMREAGFVRVEPGSAKSGPKFVATRRHMGLTRHVIRAAWLQRERARCSKVGAFIIREPLEPCPLHDACEAAPAEHGTWDTDSLDCLCLLSTVLVDEGPRPKEHLGQRIKYLR